MVPPWAWVRDSKSFDFVVLYSSVSLFSNLGIPLIPYRVIDGADSTLDAIERVPANEKNRPLQEIRITNVRTYKFWCDTTDWGGIYLITINLFRLRSTQTLSLTPSSVDRNPFPCLSFTCHFNMSASPTLTELCVYVCILLVPFLTQSIPLALLSSLFFQCFSFACHLSCLAVNENVCVRVRVFLLVCIQELRFMIHFSRHHH